VVLVVDQVLGPALPLLFTSDGPFWGSGILFFFGIELNGGSVWDSSVGLHHQVVLMVDQVLGPVLPLLFSSNRVFWLLSSFLFFLSIELNGRLIWNSCVGLVSLLI